MDTYQHEPSRRPYDEPPRTSGGWSRLLTIFLVALCVALLLRDLGATFFTGRAEPRAVTPRGNFADDEKATIEVFENASPAVVFITSTTLRSDFFGLNMMEIPKGTGSGFIWDKAGHIVTNYHVIQDANRIEVILSDHSKCKARLIGAEPGKDLAVLRISAPADRIVPIPIGTSSDLQVGQKVFAIGNPFGLDQTLTTGIVSALGRSIRTFGDRTIQDVIQTDAAINPGNSGGPLLDSAGRLIGINTAIMSPSGTSAGVGFAVPVDTVNQVIPQLVKYGRVIKPRLGVALARENFARSLGITGVLIFQVDPDLGAAQAGLRGMRRAANGSLVLGDVIQKVGGENVRSRDDLLNILEKHKVGDTVEVTVLREDRTLTVDVVLE